MRRLVWSLVVCMMVGALAFTVGCQFGGGNPVGESYQLMNTAAAPVGGNARVSFNIMVSADENTGQAASYRAETTGAEVQFTLIGIRSGEQSGPTTATLTRTVPVNSDGTAEVTFENVPELSTLAQIRIQGANIRGYRDFHGGADLRAGNNLLTVNPVGSGLKQDLLARVMKDTIANPTLVRAAPRNMCARVTMSLNSISLDVATSTRAIDAFNTFVSQLQPAGFTRLQQTAANDGFVMGNATFTNTQLFAERPTDYTAIDPTQLQIDRVFRQGFGEFGLVGFQSPDDAVNSLVQIDPTDPNRRFSCFAPGPITCVAYLFDGSIVAGGFHKQSGIPFLFRWNGFQAAALPAIAPTTELPTPPQGLAWLRHFLPASGITGTNAAPAIVEAIAYNPMGDELIATVRIPDGIRIFRVHAIDGQNMVGFTEPAAPIMTPPPEIVIASPSRQVNVAPGTALTMEAEAQTAPAFPGAPPVVRVQFFQGAMILGDATRVGDTNRWRFVWQNVPMGYHQVMARVFDNAGASRMSNPLEVFAMPLNVQRPGVGIASPTNGAVFEAGVPINIVARVVASDTIQRVEFWNGPMLIGETGSAPYAFRWQDPMPGAYMLVAKAYTVNGGFAVSDPINILVNPPRPEWDMPPMLEVVQPTFGQAFDPSANVNIVVGAVAGTVLDPRKIRRIEFLRMPAEDMAIMPMGPAMPSVRGEITDTMTETGWDTGMLTGTGGDTGMFTGTGMTTTNTDPFPMPDQPVNFWMQDPNALPPGAFKLGEVTLPDPQNPRQFRFVWQRVPQGLHHIVARVFDDFGAMTELPWVLIRVGSVNAPPRGFIMYHEPWEPARNQTVTIHIQAHDPDGTIARVEMLINGMPLPGAPTPVGNEPGHFQWQGTIPGELPLGPVFVEAVFADNQGAIGRTPPAMVPYGGANATGILTGWDTGMFTGTGVDTGMFTGTFTGTGMPTGSLTGTGTGTGMPTGTFTDTGVFTGTFTDTGMPTGSLTGTGTATGTEPPQNITLVRPAAGSVLHVGNTYVWTANTPNSDIVGVRFIALMGAAPNWIPVPVNTTPVQRNVTGNFEAQFGLPIQVIEGPLNIVAHGFTANNVLIGRSNVVQIMVNSEPEPTSTNTGTMTDTGVFTGTFTDTGMMTGTGTGTGSQTGLPVNLTIINPAPNATRRIGVGEPWQATSDDQNVMLVRFFLIRQTVAGVVEIPVNLTPFPIGTPVTHALPTELQPGSYQLIARGFVTPDGMPVGVSPIIPLNVVAQ